ncbi:hypothetical protein [Lysobacter auxotrophicus]|uniref:Outer membrane beta-barrel protein n=1 Tax=Lysobacter auxotrophicus TaxID=2992573 RepID=A0ABM8DAT7_9GAMM|nr:hypothetical protein [Lysobacter auxotrophicus]BDU15690.1 outer membrane beta-barrel protein [Lysobacter auxotrophicus]
MKKSLFALALVAAPFFAHASESNGIGYTYAQLDYVYQDGAQIDGFNTYPNGFNLSGSYAFTDNVFATASYGGTEDSRYHAKYKNPNWSLGVGFNNAIGANADWVSQLTYVDSDARVRLDSDFWGCTDCRANMNYQGGTITTGVLGRVVDGLTANAYLGYEDYNHRYDGNFFADFGVVYAFNKTWGLHGGLKLAEGVDTYTVGVRASF